jgi:hypothetical protein
MTTEQQKYDFRLALEAKPNASHSIINPRVTVVTSDCDAAVCGLLEKATAAGERFHADRIG